MPALAERPSHTGEWIVAPTTNVRTLRGQLSCKPEIREPPSSPGDGSKPGRSATPCGPGASRRPYRHPIPVAPLARRNSAISLRGAALRPPRANRPRRRRGRGAARCGAATLEPPHYDHPRTAFVVGRASRRRRDASCSARLCGRARQARPIAVIVPAVGLARGEERRSDDGPAGRASLIAQNQPTGVTTRCGLRCSAGLRQRLDAVACLCIQSNSSLRGSARVAPACHRNVVLQA